MSESYDFIFGPARKKHAPPNASPSSGEPDDDAVSADAMVDLVQRWRRGRAEEATSVLCAHCGARIRLGEATQTGACPACGKQLSERAERPTYGRSAKPLSHAERHARGMTVPPFQSAFGRGFHLTPEQMKDSLDLPFWFLNMSGRHRELVRIPVNAGNVWVLPFLLAAALLTLLGALMGLVGPSDERIRWRILMTFGALGAIGLLALRPYLQSYLTVGREKIMLIQWGQRQVIHYGRIEAITNARRLNPVGYAEILRRRGLRPIAWVYLVVGRWFDPRGWMHTYDPELVLDLPDEAGDTDSEYLDNCITLVGEQRKLRIPYNGRRRRDLTQTLAVVVFQTWNLNPGAKIDVAALQAAQHAQATRGQWRQGMRG